MEGSQSTLQRVSRAMWTVWGVVGSQPSLVRDGHREKGAGNYLYALYKGYLTGTVGRYLGLEVTNEEAHSVQFKQEGTVVINKSHKELKAKEEEKKTRADLQYPRVGVRDAAVQWEKGNLAHCGREAEEKSEHTCASSGCIDKKSPTKKHKEKALDDRSGSGKTRSNQFIESEDSFIYKDAGKKHSDRAFSESKKADLNVQRRENNQEQIKELKEEETIVKRLFDKTEEEPTKNEIIDQALLSEDADLNVERSDYSQEQEEESELGKENASELITSENNNTEEELSKRDSLEQGLLTKEIDLNFKCVENSQEHKEEKEETGVKIIERAYEEFEREPVKSKSIEQHLLAKEAYPVETNENQNQEKKQEDEEDGVDEVMMSQFVETKEEPIKSESTDQGLLTKEFDLYGRRIENSQEQCGKQEEEGVNLIKRKFDEFEKEPAKSKLLEQGLLVKDVGVNVERNENSQEWEMEEDCGDEIRESVFDATEEEPLKIVFTDQGLLTKTVDLNVEKIKHCQEHRSKQEEEEECVDKIMKNEFDKTEKEPIEIESSDQNVLTKKVLNAEIIKNRQEQRREEEDDVDVEPIKRENDEMGGKMVKYEFIKEGLLAKEADQNVENNENNQGQEKEEEGVDETMKGQNNQAEEKPIKSEFTNQTITKKADLNVERERLIQEQSENPEEESVDETGEEPNESKFMVQGLLAMDVDLNVGKIQTNQEQGRKSEEGSDEILKRDDKTEEDLIKCEFVVQDLLAKETDVERSGHNQEQEREEIEEEHDEIIKRQNDATDEEPIKSEFTDQGIIRKEAYLNVERTENGQEQKREQEEECVDETLRIENDESEEEPIKCEFIKQSLLVKETDLNGKRNENSQEQRRKPEVEEEVVEQILRREHDKSEEESIKGKFIDQGLDPDEQPSECDMGDTAVVQVVSVEKIIECVNDQDKNEPNGVQQSINPVHDCVKLDIEMTENTIQLQEKEVFEVDSEKMEQAAVGKEKDETHEKRVWKHVTGTDIVQEEMVGDTQMQETWKLITDDIIDKNVETECKLLEMTQIESDPCKVCEDEDDHLADTVELQWLGQRKEKDAMNVDLRQFDHIANDHNSSEQSAVMSEQGTEGVLTRPETETGNQMETVETASKFRAEVASVYVKKSAERETSSCSQHIDTSCAANSSIMGQCVLEQESLLDKSSDKRITDLSLLKAPFSEIKLVANPEHVDETEVGSDNEIPRTSLEELDMCSGEAQVQVEDKPSFPEQTAAMFETEISSDELKSEQAPPKREILLVENTLIDEEDQLNQNECTMQDSATEASSHRLQLELSEAFYIPEKELEQETQEMLKDSPKVTEEQVRIDEAGLLDEIKDFASCFGVVDEISGLTKESEASEWELLKEMQASERKQQKNDLEIHDEDLVAEMTDMDSMAGVSASEMESVKMMDKPITKEVVDTSQLVFSESEPSKETNKECEETVEHERSLVDSKEEGENIGRLKRGFEKIAGDNDEDKPSELTDPLPPSQASSLDFTVQKSKIAVKNPLVRPPKDPRMLINMISVEPLTPPRPAQPGFLKKSHMEGASVPSKGVVGFKLPGLGAGFPVLRKTEVGKKIRDGEDTECVTPQTADSGLQSGDDNVKQETPPQKPKWTPPRQPGIGSPLMMAELKSKLKKPGKE